MITCAIGKFTSLGLLVAKIYPSQTGGHSTWLESPAAAKPLIEKVWGQLSEVNHLSDMEVSTANDNVSKTVQLARVLTLTNPKL